MDIIKYLFNNINNRNIFIVFTCIYINKVTLYLRSIFVLYIIKNNNINIYINKLSKKYKLDNLCIKSIFNICSNSIIGSIFFINNFLKKRNKFIFMLKKYFLNKKLFFILSIINFNDVKIGNPIFWLLTFIIDSIKLKCKFYSCIFNIDQIYLINKIINMINYNNLILINIKLINYIKNINNVFINKYLLLTENILYIEKLIK